MSNFTIKSIADLLTAARKRKGLTQSQLAHLLAVPQSYIARIEAGGTDLRTSKLVEIARLVDLELFFVEKKLAKHVELVIGEDYREFLEQDTPAYQPDEVDGENGEIY